MDPYAAFNPYSFGDDDPTGEGGNPPPVGDAPPPPTDVDPLSGIPQGLIDAFYGNGTIANRQLAADYLKPFVDPYNAHDWKSLFGLFTKGLTPNQSILSDAFSTGPLSRLGFHLSPANTQGQISKIQLPGFDPNDKNKGWVRVLEGDPIKGGSWTWMDQGDGGGGDPGGYGFAIDPSYLAPWDKDFSFPDFMPPNEADLKADPSYLWRRNNAVGAYENSAAARGLLNSSNSPYDIGTLADALAAQEFGNVFSRKWGVWKDARDSAFDRYKNQQDTFYKNQNNPADKLFRGAELGYNANA